MKKYASRHPPYSVHYSPKASYQRSPLKNMTNSQLSPNQTLKQSQSVRQIMRPRFGFNTKLSPIRDTAHWQTSEKRKAIESENTLSKYIQQYMVKQDPEARLRLQQQLNYLHRVLTSIKSTASAIETLEMMEFEHIGRLGLSVSKLFFYQFYGQVAMFLDDWQAAFKYFKNCEFYSRVLEFDAYTLQICFRVAEIQKNQGAFEVASHYYQKSLELALLLGDKYSEMKAIDSLGICYYYRGNAAVAHYFHSRVEGLSRIENDMIKEHYSNKYCIQKLLDEQFSKTDSSRQNEYSEFGVKNAMLENFDDENNKEAVKSMHDQSKNGEFRGSVPRMRQQFAKAANVGTIYRYSPQGKSHYGRFASESTDSVENKNQVILSHFRRIKVLQQEKKSGGVRKVCRGMLGKLQSIIESIG